MLTRYLEVRLQEIELMSNDVKTSYCLRKIEIYVIYVIEIYLKYSCENCLIDILTPCSSNFKSISGTYEVTHENNLRAIENQRLTAENISLRTLAVLKINSDI